MLKTKPVVLWVHNASYIVVVSGNHNSDTRVGSRKIGASFLHCSLGNNSAVVDRNVETYLGCRWGYVCTVGFYIL